MLDATMLSINKCTSPSISSVPHQYIHTSLISKRSRTEDDGGEKENECDVTVTSKRPRVTTTTAVKTSSTETKKTKSASDKGTNKVTMTSKSAAGVKKKSKKDTETKQEADTSLGSTTLEAPLRVKLLSEKARVPKRASALAAGYDLCSSVDIVIPAGERKLVPTDLAVEIPVGTYGRVAPRSGLSAKHFIDVGAGVVDADYRGPLMILLFNFGKEDFQIKEGDRIAQLVLERIYTPDVVVVDELDDTERGANGFGSTGIKSE
jgi:dUTP pyrophosphatase